MHEARGITDIDIAVGPDLTGITSGLPTVRECGGSGTRDLVSLRDIMPRAGELHARKKRSLADQVYERIVEMASWCKDDTAPYALTQSGLAEHFGKTRPRIAVETRKLISRGKVDAIRARIIYPHGLNGRNNRLTFIPSTEPENKRQVRALAEYAVKTLGIHGTYLLRKELDDITLYQQLGR